MIDAKAAAAAARVRLAAGQRQLRETFEAGGRAVVLLEGRVRQVDAALIDLWRQAELPARCALVAVGGYGRGELFPSSDVDVLFLVPDSTSAEHREPVERFVGLLWDSGLEAGHSVRSPDDCLDEARRDITVQTSLLEARWLAGSKPLFRDFRTRFDAELDAAEFFQAKRLEQVERHARHHDTPYSLEPNCKEHPGSLRDLQVLLWVARAAGLGCSWRDLARSGIVSADEARQLERVERLLRTFRIHLHHLVGRREDRLLFDHQERLAAAMGIGATAERRASEVLMQRYYQNAKRVTQLNSMIMAALGDRLLPGQTIAPIVIDASFQTQRDQLDIRDERLFERRPRAMLEAFLLLMQRSELKGLSSRALRALWRNRTRIDAAFRRSQDNRALLLRLFQQKHLILALRLMNQFDVLGQCIPAFGRVVGQMQHDLFHVYTVDQHILQVIRNLRRFAMPEFAHEYPFCSRLMAGLDDRWVLYVAALFHDIAKGRGGDHSRLGAADAARFCREHAVPPDHAELIVFLVEHHLTMSTVAQKQDLTDPEVVRAFVATVGTHRRLTALYLLTVADIRGTSPKVWNAWKGKLLEDLFRMAAKMLAGDQPPQLGGVPQRQEEALRLLRYHGLRPGIEQAFWQELDTAYFVRHEPEEVAWHTRALYHRATPPDPVVKARLNPHGPGLQVMVYVADQPQLFARLCGFFARLGYTIVDAKIHTTRHGFALDSFILLGTDAEPGYRDMIGLIEHDLTGHLAEQGPLPPPVAGRLSRQVKHFPIAPEVTIQADEQGRHHVMSIHAADRPGLLYSVARILDTHGISLQTAKIATLGERVEDVFLISGAELGQTASLVRLEQDLLAALRT